MPAADSTHDAEAAAYVAHRPKLPAGPGKRLLHAGIDENGLGPKLGPLIVTGVAFEGAERPTTLGDRVGDSKALVSFGDSALGEAWARALFSRVIGRPPTAARELLDALLIDGADVRQALCPPTRPNAGAGERVSAMCWPDDDPPFEASADSVVRCTETLDRAVGDRRVAIAAHVVCAAALNREFSNGVNKLRIDLHTMERIALALVERSGAPTPLDAVCGKVGGFDRYGDQLGPLSGRLVTIEQEARVASAYRFPGLGRLAFVRNADDVDPLVGLASLVGKYIRDLFMHRLGRYFRGGVDGVASLPAASGYHDVVTRRFIEGASLVRERRGVPDRCFLRSK